MVLRSRSNLMVGYGAYVVQDIIQQFINVKGSLSDAYGDQVYEIQGALWVKG